VAPLGAGGSRVCSWVMNPGTGFEHQLPRPRQCFPHDTQGGGRTFPNPHISAGETRLFLKFPMFFT